MRSKAQQLTEELERLVDVDRGIEAAAVVTLDGLTMASALPEGMDEERLGAMSAALLSLGEQAGQSFGRGRLRQVLVEADRGVVVLTSADDDAVLVVVADVEARIGLVRYQLRRAATAAARILAGPGEDVGVEAEPLLDDLGSAPWASQVPDLDTWR